jgi:hypothetical protein
VLGLAVPASGPTEMLFITPAEPDHQTCKERPMADSPISLSHAEIQALADRLLSRGVSKLSADRPALQADLRTAAAVIRSLSREHREGVTVTVFGETQ